MTFDTDVLHAALDDLAAAMPADPTPTAVVHRLARRRRHHQRMVGAGALAAALATAGVGADAWLQSGRSPLPVTPATAPAAPAVPPALAACAGVTPQAKPSASSAAAPAAPTIGQAFSGGGVVAGPATATAITVRVIGGPAGGTTLTLGVTADSKIYVTDPTTGVTQVTTGDHLQVGWAVKFTATMTATASYVIDDLHSSPIAPGDQAPTIKQTVGPQIPVPPPVGGPVKVSGVVLSTTATSITVEVLQGNVDGTVTFALRCTLTEAIVGSRIAVAGTRTSTTSYQADQFSLSAPVANP